METNSAPLVVPKGLRTPERSSGETTIRCVNHDLPTTKLTGKAVDRWLPEPIAPLPQAQAAVCFLNYHSRFIGAQNFPTSVDKRVVVGRSKPFYFI
jgi:hypothetical protein